MADLLTRVYEATIAHVTSAMPLEMRLLAKLTEEPSGAKREEMLRAAIPSANAAEEGSKEPGRCSLALVA